MTLRTPAEWAALTGIEVLDPDGWDRRARPGCDSTCTTDCGPCKGTTGRAFDEPITEAEFRERAFSSTIRGAL